jgi:hypothetical protein
MKMKQRPIDFDPQRRAAQAGLKAKIMTFTMHLEAEERSLG